MTAASSAAGLSQGDRRQSRLPTTWVADALCVHSAWHHRLVHGRREVRRADYVLDRHAYVATYHVPRNKWADNGEGPWHIHNGYEGGMQFTYSTWQSARHLAVAYGITLPEHAYLATPLQQLWGAYVVWRARGSWADWPNTARACGLY